MRFLFSPVVYQKQDVVTDFIHDYLQKLIDISGSCKPGFPDSLIECDMTVFIKFNTLTLFERRLSKTFFLIIELHSNRNLNCFDKLWKWKTQSEFHISCD